MNEQTGLFWFKVFYKSMKTCDYVSNESISYTMKLVEKVLALIMNFISSQAKQLSFFKIPVYLEGFDVIST